jgi:hypothetical protein
VLTIERYRGPVPQDPEPLPPGDLWRVGLTHREVPMVRRVCDRKVMLDDGRTIPAGAPFMITKAAADRLEKAGYPIRVDHGDGGDAEADAEVVTTPGPAETKPDGPEETRPWRRKATKEGGSGDKP